MENQLRKLTLGLHCVTLHCVSASRGAVSHHPLLVFGMQDGVGLRGPAAIEELLFIQTEPKTLKRSYCS